MSCPRVSNNVLKGERRKGEERKGKGGEKRRWEERGKERGGKGRGGRGRSKEEEEEGRREEERRAATRIQTEIGKDGYHEKTCTYIEKHSQPQTLQAESEKQASEHNHPHVLIYYSIFHYKIPIDKTGCWRASQCSFRIPNSMTLGRLEGVR